MNKANRMKKLTISLSGLWAPCYVEGKGKSEITTHLRSPTRLRLWKFNLGRHSRARSARNATNKGSFEILSVKLSPTHCSHFEILWKYKHLRQRCKRPCRSVWSSRATDSPCMAWWGVEELNIYFSPVVVDEYDLYIILIRQGTRSL